MLFSSSLRIQWLSFVTKLDLRKIGLERVNLSEVELEKVELAQRWPGRRLIERKTEPED